MFRRLRFLIAKGLTIFAGTVIFLAGATVLSSGFWFLALSILDQLRGTRYPLELHWIAFIAIGLLFAAFGGKVMYLAMKMEWVQETRLHLV